MVAVYPGLAPAIVTGEIAAPVFFWLARSMKHVLALARVQQTNAVSLAVGLVMGDRDAVLRLARKDVEEAFPHG